MAIKSKQDTALEKENIQDYKNAETETLVADALYSRDMGLLDSYLEMFDLLSNEVSDDDVRQIKTLAANSKTLRSAIENLTDDEIKEQVYINIKYEGYIVKANKEAEKMVNLDNKMIPNDIDYDKIHNLASEAKQKLKEVMPTSIGQALRISGVNPADISILMIYLKKEYHYDRRNI